MVERRGLQYPERPLDGSTAFVSSAGEQHEAGCCSWESTCFKVLLDLDRMNDRGEAGDNANVVFGLVICPAAVRLEPRSGSDVIRGFWGI